MSNAPAEMTLSRTKAEFFASIKHDRDYVRDACHDALVAHDLRDLLAAKDAEIERLQEWSRLRGEDLMTLANKLGQAEAERDAAVKALEPFAAITRFTPAQGDTYTYTLRAELFRAAKASLPIPKTETESG